MRHRIKGKKLNRSASHRNAMYRNLVSSLVKHEAIVTTLPKAKAVRPIAERLVTKARVGDLNARRQMLQFFYEKPLVDKMLSTIGPRFAGRSGGYTRIVKLGERATDRSSMARLEFVERSSTKEAMKEAPKSKKEKAQPVKKEATSQTDEKETLEKDTDDAK